MKLFFLAATAMIGTAAIAQPGGQPPPAHGPDHSQSQPTNPSQDSTSQPGGDQSPTDPATQAPGTTNQGMAQGTMGQGTNTQAAPPPGQMNQGQMNHGQMGHSGSAMAQPPAPRPSAGDYPPCSRTVTDSCIQTNERRARRRR